MGFEGAAWEHGQRRSKCTAPTCTIRIVHAPPGAGHGVEAAALQGGQRGWSCGGCWWAGAQGETRWRWWVLGAGHGCWAAPKCRHLSFHPPSTHPQHPPRPAASGAAPPHPRRLHPPRRSAPAGTCGRWAGVRRLHPAERPPTAAPMWVLHGPRPPLARSHQAQPASLAGAVVQHVDGDVGARRRAALHGAVANVQRAGAAACKDSEGGGVHGQLCGGTAGADAGHHNTR